MKTIFFTVSFRAEPLKIQVLSNLVGNAVKFCPRNPSFLFLISLVTVLVCGTRLYTRVDTTLLGYKIGELKKRESFLLEKNSQLRVELAKISSKSHLLNLAKYEKDPKKASSLAAN